MCHTYMATGCILAISAGVSHEYESELNVFRLCTFLTHTSLLRLYVYVNIATSEIAPCIEKEVSRLTDRAV